MLGHKTNINKFNRIEIISNIFSHNDAVQLEINYTNKIGKLTNAWKIHNI